MITVCQTCQARIQLDDAKIPPLPFSIKCPKCANIVSLNATSSPASQKSGLALGGSPSTEHPRFERQKPAPAFELKGNGQSAELPVHPTSELAKVLAELLEQRQSAKRSRERRKTDRRQVLVCAAESRRESIAQRLAENDYQVFVAEDTRQAVERMRENQLEIVLLDPDFDPSEQGAAFVTREVNVLQPAQRRRLFFGVFSSSLRTLDAHAAFLSNANLTINLTDLDDLTSVLEDAVREYNTLYSDFFQALNVHPL